MLSLRSIPLFLVLLFVQSNYAMQRLGKVASPQTGFTAVRLMQQKIRQELPRKLSDYSQENALEKCKHCNMALAPVILKDGTIRKMPVRLQHEKESEGETSQSSQLTGDQKAMIGLGIAIGGTFGGIAGAWGGLEVGSVFWEDNPVFAHSDEAQGRLNVVKYCGFVGALTGSYQLMKIMGNPSIPKRANIIATGTLAGAMAVHTLYTKFKD